MPPAVVLWGKAPCWGGRPLRREAIAAGGRVPPAAVLWGEVRLCCLRGVRHSGSILQICSPCIFEFLGNIRYSHRFYLNCSPWLFQH